MAPMNPTSENIRHRMMDLFAILNKMDIKALEAYKEMLEERVTEAGIKLAYIEIPSPEATFLANEIINNRHWLENADMLLKLRLWHIEHKRKLAILENSPREILTP